MHSVHSSLLSHSTALHFRLLVAVQVRTGPTSLLAQSTIHQTKFCFLEVPVPVQLRVAQSMSHLSNSRPYNQAGCIPSLDKSSRWRQQVQHSAAQLPVLVDLEMQDRVCYKLALVVVRALFSPSNSSTINSE